MENFNTRVTIKRSTNSSDGYGGTTSVINDYKTVWAKKVEKKGNVDFENGSQKRYLSIDLLMRKRTADLISYTDTLQIEGETGTFRVTSIVENVRNFFTTLKATRID